MPAVDSTERVLRLTRRRGSITRREVVDAGIHTHTLSRLVQTGALERISRGRYRLPGAPITEHHSLALVAAAAPKAVVCLLSALSFHQIGTQLPAEVWIAIERRARKPALREPPLRVVRFSGAAFTEGIEIHRVERETVRVYSVAKTLADLFKHRNKVGLDVAIEALREAWRDRKFTMEALDRAARACRVARVMNPYVEAVVA